MSTSYILIKNATVVPVDRSDSSKVLTNHDILIENSYIKSVGPNLSLPSASPSDSATATATTIDAKDCIITPGFVDGHHHMWQHFLRGLTVDWTLFGYCCHLRAVYGSLYNAEDVYVANYAAALSLLNNGVTSVLDHCHVINSPEHGDAAVRGLKEAGIRGTFCYGFYQNPTVAGEPASVGSDGFNLDARIEDARRVKRELFPGDNDPATSLLTFGIALDEAPMRSREANVEGLEIARKLGARISTVHTSVISSHGRPRAEVVQQFEDAGAMGSDIVFSHGAWMTDEELDAVRRSGAGIIGTPDTELQMGMGYPIIWKAGDLGCRTGLGLDITSNQGNDFLAQMRLALQVQRAREDDYQTIQRDVGRKTADILRKATLGGAEAMQMDSVVGSIEPGKKADLVFFRCDDIDMVPVLDPIGTVVFHASSKNVDTVIVDGKIVKQDGRLVGLDWKSLRDQVQSRSERMRDEAAKIDMTGPESLFYGVFAAAMQEGKR
ncbi:uncharacterized protein BJX67DRAFT_325801 [Aspergillus lucknowensis]|uniref:Amidohydrolase-related domain-containing protein n=1 Tax=Aspergillus lucknowensis TaxID=176173 RepID=A0ABR4L8H7_9EURO